MRVRDLPYAHAAPQLPFASGGYCSTSPSIVIEVDEAKLRGAESRVEILFSNLDLRRLQRRMPQCVI